MESRAALGAAAALALTVTGGVSALFLTVGQAASGDSPAGSNGQIATVEYVDQFGNPVAPPTMGAAEQAPQIVLLNPDGTPLDGTTPTAPAQPGYPADEYPEGEYPEDEYEDEEYPEDEYPEEEYEEDEHEDDDEYGEDEHEYEEAGAPIEQGGYGVD